ncbi:hypothetical protein ANCCAN_14164 [Ancylostoma caninum]|uniref:Uncharacterized protein n=1 Tax=Ancylostoma caninum TaxID=29170 RepID=A0A368G634_ANCCA|nr:hypothetical protein ANCCAN_14164 [Ancylostoma caninum]
MNLGFQQHACTVITQQSIQGGHSMKAMNDYLRYDLIADYRVGSELEHELKVEEKMQRFEKERHTAGLTRRRIFRSASASR